MSQTAHQTPPRAIAIAGVFVIAALSYGFFASYSQFDQFDDEGYVMVTVKHFLEGHALYDEVFTQYGPVYYLYKGLLHLVTRIPIGHSASRLTTLLMWNLAAVIFAVCIYRLVGSLPLACLLHFLVFWHLSPMAQEPGHPQELVLVILALMACLLTPSSLAMGSRRAAIASGCLLGALAFTKLNVGLFLGAALLWTHVLSSPHQSRRLPLMRLAVLAGGLVMPFALMWRHLGADHGLNYAALVSLALLSVLLTSRGNERPPCERYLAIVSGALVGSICAFVAAMLVLGTSLAGILDGVVLQHLRFSELVWLPASIRSSAVAAGILSVAAALLYRSRFLDRVPGLRSRSGIALKGLHGLPLLAFSLCGRYDLALSFGLPLVWVVLIPCGAREAAAREQPARVFLCLLAVFGSQQAYPVSGVQQVIATVPMLLTAGLSLHDCLMVLGPRAAALRPQALAYPLLVLVWASGLWPQFTEYTRLAPLDLPGSRWMRLPEPEVAMYQSLAANLTRSSDAFLTLPGMNSFYFWTKMEPPTRFNATTWMALLGEEQQQQVLAAIARAESPCILANTRTIWSLLQDEGWSRRHRVLQFVEENFSRAAGIGAYELMCRKGAAVSLVRVARLERSRSGTVPGRHAPVAGGTVDACLEVVLDERSLSATRTIALFGWLENRVIRTTHLSDPRPDNIGGSTVVSELPAGPVRGRDRVYAVRVSLPGIPVSAISDGAVLVVRLLDEAGNRIASIPLVDSPSDDPWISRGKKPSHGPPDKQP